MGDVRAAMSAVGEVAAILDDSAENYFEAASRAHDFRFYAFCERHGIARQSLARNVKGLDDDDARSPAARSSGRMFQKLIAQLRTKFSASAIARIEDFIRRDDMLLHQIDEVFRTTPLDPVFDNVVRNIQKAILADELELMEFRHSLKNRH
jgi:hypothetical protein